MLTLMNNVEKDAATRTNTGKTEKETRPNQPARDQPAREPSLSQLLLLPHQQTIMLSLYQVFGTHSRIPSPG